MSQTLIDISGLTQIFPGEIRALQGVDLTIRSKEILGIMGENGAGKSTLMFVLSGFLSPTEGEIRLEKGGEGSPGNLQNICGMIHQKPLLAGELSVFENIIMERRLPVFRPETLKREIRAVQERYGLPLELDRKVRELTAPEIQRCELIRALWKEKRIIILDEPTAALSESQSEELFSLMKELKAEGRTLLFITHKIHEALDCCDRIAVLRQGKPAGGGLCSALTAAEISRMMIGLDNSEEKDYAIPNPQNPEAEVVLEMRDVEYREQGVPRLSGLNLRLRASEILGIGGIRENGLIHLENLLSGTRIPSSGQILIGGREYSPLTPYRLRRRGVAYIPADRLVRGASPESTLAENISILSSEGGRGSYRRNLIRRAVNFIKIHSIKGEPEQKAKTLSGGNLQKMIVARELGDSPGLIIVSEPSWGLDFRSRSILHNRLREAREQGSAILLLTTDLDELLALSDRISILTEGRLTEIQATRREWNRRFLGERMTGADRV